MRDALPAGEGEGGLAASSDGLGSADPLAGQRDESVRCSRGAPGTHQSTTLMRAHAPGSLLMAGAALTRRDLLAGAAAAPSALALRGSAASPPPGQRQEARSAWDEALPALTRAEEEIAAFKRAEPKGVPFAVQWELDEAFSDLASAQNAALEALLLTPAPDAAALAAKLARAVAEMAWELPEGEATMACIAADAAALASQP
ncbi:MAG: hypothetical protein JO013_11335 [Alphaproteobacteria bacterium]|nr:hypothetical protein [Alphaproteobacteria bacterium]